MRSAPEVLQRLRGVACDDHPVAQFLQTLDSHGEHRLVVVHEQHRLAHAGSAERNGADRPVSRHLAGWIGREWKHRLTVVPRPTSDLVRAKPLALRVKP